MLGKFRLILFSKAANELQKSLSTVCKDCVVSLEGFLGKLKVLSTIGSWSIDPLKMRLEIEMHRRNSIAYWGIVASYGLAMVRRNRKCTQ